MAIDVTKISFAFLGNFSFPILNKSLTLAIPAYDVVSTSAITGYAVVRQGAVASYEEPSVWQTDKITSITVSAEGFYRFFLWAKNADGYTAVESFVFNAKLDDTIPPTINTFSLPATSSTNVGIVVTSSVTDSSESATPSQLYYYVSESPVPPTFVASIRNTYPSFFQADSWCKTLPTTWTFTKPPDSVSTVKYLYLWVADEYGNISSATAQTIITIPDTSKPWITSFSLGTLSGYVLPITIYGFDNVSSGTSIKYRVTESATPPLPSDSWSSPLTSYTFSRGGYYQLYPWAKDAAGNISSVYLYPPAILVPDLGDVTKPVITSFTTESTVVDDNTIEITSFTATDDSAVVGYLVQTSATPPSANSQYWTTTPPTFFTTSLIGTITLYAFVKDSNNNISNAATSVVDKSVTYSFSSSFTKTFRPTIQYNPSPLIEASLTVSLDQTAEAVQGVTAYAWSQFTDVAKYDSINYIPVVTYNLNGIVQAQILTSYDIGADVVSYKEWSANPVITVIGASSVTFNQPEDFAFSGSIQVIDTLAAGLDSKRGNDFTFATNMRVIRSKDTYYSEEVDLSFSLNTTIKHDLTCTLFTNSNNEITFSSPIKIIGNLIALTPATNYNTYVLNTFNAAHSEYTNHWFNSYFKLNNQYYGINATGVCQLTGDLDGTVIIDSEVRTPVTSFDKQGLKACTDAIVLGRLNADIELSTVVDEKEQREPFVVRADDREGLHRIRAKIHKGLKGSTWQFVIKNSNGGQFAINNLEVFLKELQRVR